MSEASADPWDRRTTWLRRWLAASWLALIAATWRLWTPQTVFPQIPFLAALRTAPAWLDWVGLAALVLGLAGLLLAPRTSKPDASRVPPLRGATLLTVAALTLLVLLDQHRFQPWAYQFAVAALVLAFAPAPEAASLLRVLAVAIYFWSAVSKFDYTFLHSMGRQLSEAIFRAFGVNSLDYGDVTLLAWTLPIEELAVAILLAVRRTRTIGLVLSIVMHALLLVALGPFGQNHEPGVLLWNVYFIGQNLFLFRRPAAGWRRTAGPGAIIRLREIARGLIPSKPSAGVGHVAVYAAVWLPALEPFGLIDHWPAWAVYSPSGERVALLVPYEDGQRLGFDQWEGHYFAIDNFGAPWRLLDDFWSLESLHAPVYPQGRFRVGVALAEFDRQKLEDVATLTVWSRADRFTGARRVSKFQGEQIRAYAASFWLNALPRQPWDR